MYRIVLFYFGWEKLVSILSRKIYAACSSEIFLSEILVENQNCTISVGIFSVYISKGFIPFRNRVIPNADHWMWYNNVACDKRISFINMYNRV